MQDAVRKSAVNKTCRKMLLARLSVISSAASAETRRKKERERGKKGSSLLPLRMTTRERWRGLPAVEDRSYNNRIQHMKITK